MLRRAMSPRLAPASAASAVRSLTPADLEGLPLCVKDMSTTQTPRPAAYHSEGLEITAPIAHVETLRIMGGAY